jgi:putative hydrolase of the HAD superfamily
VVHRVLHQTYARRVVVAVLFDMGGVLVSSPFAGFARYERSLGVPEGTIRRINATDPDVNAWALFERGHIDAEEFVARFESEALAVGYELDAREVLATLRSDPIPQMVEALPRVRRVAATALLTNNIRPLDVGGSVASALLRHFDVVVQSSVEGVRKPDPAFYERACTRLGVAAEECVFLDDLGVNLKPARALGMRTIKVIDADSALVELEEILGISLR